MTAILGVTAPPSQDALGRGDRVALDTHRVAQGARERLARRLDDVVAVLAGERTNVQRDPRAVDKALPELPHELRIEGADPLGDRVDLVREKRPTGQVERDL